MVHFPKPLAIALGLSDIKVTLRQSRNEEKFGIKHKDECTVLDCKKLIAPHIMDLNRGLYMFFIYCYIVRYQLVSDSYVPLLKNHIHHLKK